MDCEWSRSFSRMSHWHRIDETMPSRAWSIQKRWRWWGQNVDICRNPKQRCFKRFHYRSELQSHGRLSKVAFRIWKIQKYLQMRPSGVACKTDEKCISADDAARWLPWEVAKEYTGAVPALDGKLAEKFRQGQALAWLNNHLSNQAQRRYLASSSSESHHIWILLLSIAVFAFNLFWSSSDIRNVSDWFFIMN